MLNWLFFLVPLITHWYSWKHEDDFLLQRTPKVLAVGLIVTKQLPQFSVKLYHFFKRHTFCLLLPIRPKVFSAITEVSIREAKLVLSLVQRSLYRNKILDKTTEHCSRNSFFFHQMYAGSQECFVKRSYFSSTVLFIGFIIYYSFFVAVKQNFSPQNVRDSRR